MKVNLLCLVDQLANHLGSLESLSDVEIAGRLVEPKLNFIDVIRSRRLYVHVDVSFLDDAHGNGEAL